MVEIAFAYALLVGTGLLIRGFLRVLDVNMGFRPESAAHKRSAARSWKNALHDVTLL